MQVQSIINISAVFDVCCHFIDYKLEVANCDLKLEWNNDSAIAVY